MIRVPISINSRGSSAFTLPWVPTGMNTGVSMTPRLVVSRPRRALEPGSVLSNSNMNGRLPSPDSTGQFQKGNHTLLQIGCGQFQHFFQRDRILHVVLAGRGAAEGGQVRATADLLSEIVRHAADIGALGAGHDETANGLLVFGEAKVVDVD